MKPNGSSYLRNLIFVREKVADFSQYPYSIPALRSLDSLDFHPQVTFFVGENGSGKSTLVEAIAVAAGFNAEGGSQNFQFATRRSESDLGRCLRLGRSPRRPRTGYFLRAESYFNVATEIERLDAEGGGPRIIDSYGGKSLHEQSHGESFMALIRHRFGANGLYILDEPEAALSPQRQLSLLVALHDLVERQQCQFIIATHSPLLLAYPQATIYALSADGIATTRYEDTEHFTITRDFLLNREAYLHHLLRDPEE
jgi:predicted ATPase